MPRGSPRRMLTAEDEHRILEAAPPYLRVAIVLLVQTGGRTYTEGLSLRWSQVDLLHGVLHLGDDLKTTDSAQPLPLSRLACDVLKEWKKEQRLGKRVRFPESPQVGQADTDCQGSMAENSGESWRIVFPHLQSASRILHASQLGRARCRRAAGDAAQQSRDEAPLSTGNG
jgi:integrase